MCVLFNLIFGCVYNYVLLKFLYKKKKKKKKESTAGQVLL